LLARLACIVGILDVNRNTRTPDNYRPPEQSCPNTRLRPLFFVGSIWITREPNPARPLFLTGRNLRILRRNSNAIRALA
jgi:hypothetical protein